MITEVHNESGLAMASSSGIHDCISRNDISSIYGENSSNVSVGTVDVVDSKSVSEDVNRTNYEKFRKFKRTLNFIRLIELLNIVIALCALVVMMLLFTGCKSGGTNGSSTLPEFSKALDECKAQGKDAGSYTIYESCAKEADKKYGRKGENDVK